MAYRRGHWRPMAAAVRCGNHEAAMRCILLDELEEMDVPRHYDGNDFIAASEVRTPTATLRARWRAGWTMLAALVLLVLPALIAVGVYAHFRPAVVSHVVAAAKMRLDLASWAYVGDGSPLAPADASTLPALAPAPTGIPAAPAIPPAPTGIPGTSRVPASIPAASTPMPARIPDVPRPARAPALTSTARTAPPTAPSAPRRRDANDSLASRTTSVCTPEIVDRGLCRPELR